MQRESRLMKKDEKKLEQMEGNLLKTIKQFKEEFHVRKDHPQEIKEMEEGELLSRLGATPYLRLLSEAGEKNPERVSSLKVLHHFIAKMRAVEGLAPSYMMQMPFGVFLEVTAPDSHDKQGVKKALEEAVAACWQSQSEGAGTVTTTFDAKGVHLETLDSTAFWAQSDQLWKDREKAANKKWGQVFNIEEFNNLKKKKRRVWMMTGMLVWETVQRELIHPQYVRLEYQKQNKPDGAKKVHESLLIGMPKVRDNKNEGNKLEHWVGVGWGRRRMK